MSIFSQIIAGEIPSHRVYEDEHSFAFLDINPRQEGHTLVVPKREVDYLFDLPEEDYVALWASSARVATALKAVTGCRRVVVIVLGYEVPPDTHKRARRRTFPARGREGGSDARGDRRADSHRHRLSTA